MTTTTRVTTVDDTVVFEQQPGGVLRIVLTDEARERLLSDRGHEVRQRVRAAMLANAGEIAARRRWATIYRGGRPPAHRPLRATAGII